MAAVSSFQIYGLQEALKALNDFDRTLRRQITKDIQGGAGRKLVTAARSFIPTKEPLSGMAKSPLIGGRETTQWDRNQVERGIRSIVGQRARPPKNITFSNGRTVAFKGTPFSLLVLQQKDAAGAIWDHAGRSNASTVFVQNLINEGEHVGPATNPRALQPAAEQATPTVEDEVRTIVEDVMKIVNRRLV